MSNQARQFDDASDSIPLGAASLLTGYYSLAVGFWAEVTSDTLARSVDQTWVTQWDNSVFASWQFRISQPAGDPGNLAWRLSDGIGSHAIHRTTGNPLGSGGTPVPGAHYYL